MYCSSYFAMDYVITLTGTELNKRQAIQRLKQSDKYWRLSLWKRTCFAFLNDWLKENIGSETHQSKQWSKPCVVKSHTEFSAVSQRLLWFQRQISLLPPFISFAQTNAIIRSPAMRVVSSHQKVQTEDLCPLDYLSYSKKRSNRFKTLIWVQSKILWDVRILCFYFWSELKLIQQKSTVKVSYTIIYVTLEVSSCWKPHLIQEATLGRLNITLL